MTEILETIGGALVQFITSLVQALTTGFTGMFWEGEGESRKISDLGIFLLCLFSIGLAVGASKLIFYLVKNR